MKKIRFFCLFLCLLSIFSCLGLQVAAAAADTDPASQDHAAAAVNACYGLDATTAFLGSGQLVENIQSAFLYELNSDTLMYAWNPDEQVYPSSLVKILTALIAVEQGSPEDIVTVTEDVLATVPYDAVSAELKAGEQITLSDLIYCMMVGSANDAAAVIAEYIYGDQSTFVQKMNEYAQELGCTGTKFKNVHGLHDQEQYSTARDLGRILTVALRNEKFSTYFSAVRYTVPATNMSEERELSTGNFLMNRDNMEIYYDSRVTGGRTGITEDGNRCLAASAETNGLRLVSIVLGAKSTYTDEGNTSVYGSFKETTALFDAGFSGYKTAKILFAGQTLKQCSVLDGTSDVILGAQVDISTVLPEAVTFADLSFQYTDVYDAFQAPIEAGEKLSNLQIWYGSMCVAQADVYAMNSVSKIETQLSGQSKEPDSGLSQVITVILWIVGGTAILIGIMVFVRRMRVIMKRNRVKRYRRDRRRSR